MVKIVKQLIPLGHPNRKGTKITPSAVIIHYTGNDSHSATDTNNVRYAGRQFVRKGDNDYEEDGKTPFRYGSAQWYCDEDSATLAIPQNEVAWGCGDRQLPYDNGYKGQTKIAHDVFGHNQNYKTINYEICNNGNWAKACDNAIEIIAQDMIDYKIPTNMIYRHHDISGKNCPEPFVKDIKAWENFKKKIIAKINSLKKPVNPVTKVINVVKTVIAPKTQKYVVLVEKLNIRSTPEQTATNDIGDLKKGSVVEVYSVKDGWAEIRLNGKKAFVCASSSYIKKV